MTPAISTKPDVSGKFHDKKASETPLINGIQKPLELQKITVPIVNDEIVADPSQSLDNLAMSNFNPDLRGLVTKHKNLMHFSVEDELMNILGKKLKDEQN